MLTMKWKTDHEGRLVAAWKELQEFANAVQCSYTLAPSKPTVGRAKEKGPKQLNGRISSGLPARVLMKQAQFTRGLRSTSRGGLLLLLICLPLHAQDSWQGAPPAKDRRDGTIISNRRSSDRAYYLSRPNIQARTAWKTTASWRTRFLLTRPGTSGCGEEVNFLWTFCRGRATA